MLNLNPARTETLVAVIAALALASSFSGCASSDEIPALQEHEFPDDVLFDGVRFYVGPWFAPGASYAYQYVNGSMILSESSDSGYITHAVEIAECEGLSDAYDELIGSIAESVDHATGRKPVADPEFIVLDGPSFLLQYSGGHTSTEITLRGGGIAELTVPWVSSAKWLREVALSCTDTVSAAE